MKSCTFFLFPPVSAADSSNCSGFIQIFAQRVDLNFIGTSQDWDGIRAKSCTFFPSVDICV